VADDTAGDGPDDSEGGGDGTTGPSLEEPTSPTGCECGTTTPSAGAVGWLAIVPLLRRRRRSR
jgi:MYXO-CTERM domain-containing protein